MLESLDTRHPDKIHRYVELSNVGHCPNHEAPQAVARLLTAWTDATGSATASSIATTTAAAAAAASETGKTSNKKDRRTVELVPGGQQIISEPWGDIVVQERQANDIDISLADRLATSFVA